MNIIRDLLHEDKHKKEKIYLVDNNSYHFFLKNKEALITFDNIDYLDEVIKCFKKDFGYINKIYNKDKSFYQEFDYTYTFKLPIKILQPSKHLICEDYLNEIKENYEYLDKIISVALVDDEYIIIKGHTLCYEMLESGEKMVEVYLCDASDYQKDFVYICKEYNIKDVTKLNVVSKEEYEEFQNQINMMLENQ